MGKVLDSCNPLGIKGLGALLWRIEFAPSVFRELLRHFFQRFTHLAMHGIDGLQWAHHDSEFNDFAFVIARDDVDAVAVLAFNCCFKFQYRGVSVEHFFCIAKFS